MPMASPFKGYNCMKIQGKFLARWATGEPSTDRLWDRPWRERTVERTRASDLPAAALLSRVATAARFADSLLSIRTPTLDRTIITPRMRFIGHFGRPGIASTWAAANETAKSSVHASIDTGFERRRVDRGTGYGRDAAGIRRDDAAGRGGENVHALR